MAFALVIARGKGRGHALRLAGDAVTIGRDAGNDMVVNRREVSRMHARIERRGSGWVLLDRGSANGTALNGRRLAASALLHEGDHIAVGAMLFEFRRAGLAATAVARWRRIRPPVRATLVAAAVLLAGIGSECAAHPAGGSRGHEAAPGPAPSREVPAEIADAAAPPPQEDLAAGRTAYERGRRKLQERRIAPRNLYDAWKAFVEARARLKALVPRPELYAELLDLIAGCERDLARECRRLVFSADRFERYEQPGKAQQAWREVLLHFPGDDPGGCRNKALDHLVSAQPEAAPE